jgi:hypothetical protein
VKILQQIVCTRLVVIWVFNCPEVPIAAGYPVGYDVVCYRWPFAQQYVMFFGYSLFLLRSMLLSQFETRETTARTAKRFIV